MIARGADATIVAVKTALVIGAALAVACGNDGSAALDAGLPDAGGNLCPPGEFAVAISDGGPVCEPIEVATTAAIAAHCALYLGWQDSCDGCQRLPAKWGRVSLDSCENGAGAGNTCAEADLGGVTLPLFGLDLDGDVNDDDKLHIALECTPPPEDEPVAGPCPEGSFLIAADQCVTGQAAIVEYLASGCELYHGWRDSCDGCTGEPSKWGRAGSEGCSVATGADSTCTSFRLDAPVFVLGINPDGNLNDDDQLYLGLRCAGAAPVETGLRDVCPPGQLVVGIDDGGLRCASPAPAVEAFVQERWSLYYGWRDGCDNCDLPPTKWGRAGHGGCDAGEGADNTCASTPLDGTSIQLFGLNPDGDVDGNDKLYLGMAVE